MGTGKLISRIRVDDRGIEFTLTTGRSVLQMWSDPKFHISVWDYSKLVDPTVEKRYHVGDYRMGSQKVNAQINIPRELYIDLLSQCKARGLSIYTERISRGVSMGAMKSVIIST